MAPRTNMWQTHGSVFDASYVYMTADNIKQESAYDFAMYELTYTERSRGGAKPTTAISLRAAWQRQVDGDRSDGGGRLMVIDSTAAAG
eukprot:5774447-Pyramimonas_sp.AAC.2